LGGQPRERFRIIADRHQDRQDGTISRTTTSRTGSVRWWDSSGQVWVAGSAPSSVTRGPKLGSDSCNRVPLSIRVASPPQTVPTSWRRPWASTSFQVRTPRRVPKGLWQGGGGKRRARGRRKRPRCRRQIESFNLRLRRVPMPLSIADVPASRQRHRPSSWRVSASGGASLQDHRPHDPEEVRPGGVRRPYVIRAGPLVSIGGLRSIGGPRCARNENAVKCKKASGEG